MVLKRVALMQIRADAEVRSHCCCADSFLFSCEDVTARAIAVSFVLRMCVCLYRGCKRMTFVNVIRKGCVLRCRRRMGLKFDAR